MNNLLTLKYQDDMPLLMEIRGKGSIRKRYKKDGWDVSVYYPTTKKMLFLRYDRQGERISSYDKALRVLMEVNTRIKEKIFDPALYQKVSRLRFDTAIIDWFEKHIERYSPKSRRDYRNRINKILIPKFQHNDIRELSSGMIDDFYHELLEQDKNPKTIDNILSVLKAFFRDMKVHGVEPPIFPEVSKSPEIARSWCDFETFISVVNEIPAQMDREFIITCRLEWLRPGECRALMWKDIDFENDVLIVQRAFSLTELKHTKTHRVAYKHLHSTVGGFLFPRRGLPDAFVFTRKGKSYSESWARKQWNEAAKKVEVKLCLYEATRHSAASEAASSHKSIYVIKECLGHESIEATQRYAKVDMEAKRSVMEGEKVVKIRRKN